MFPLYVDDNANGYANARYMVRALGVQVIFIDYISLLITTRKYRVHEQYAEIAVILQKTAKGIKNTAD